MIHFHMLMVDIILWFSSLFDPKEIGDEMKTCVVEVIFLYYVNIILRGGSISPNI